MSQIILHVISATGSVTNMGKRHPAETCECPNRKLGCKVRVRQTELQSHVDQCLYRWVACEACGKRLLDVDLYKHQRHARCMENKLKREVGTFKNELKFSSTKNVEVRANIGGYRLTIKRAENVSISL